MRTLPGLLLFSFLATNLASETCPAAEVHWTRDVEGALRQANQSGQLILMKFTATWCGPCRKMEKETFSNPAVAELVNTTFVPVLVDGDLNKELVRNLKVDAYPAVLLVSPQMVILERLRGYKTPQQLLPILQKVASQHTNSAAPQPQFAANPAQPGGPQTASTATPPISPAGLTTTDKSSPKTEVPAFGGYCLSGVQDTRSLISGTPEWTIKYRGRRLHFSNAKQRDAFVANPEEYWPQKDGYCPVTLVDDNQAVEGRLEFAATFRGKLWVTQSAEAMKKFVADPARYADAAAARQVAGTPGPKL